MLWPDCRQARTLLVFWKSIKPDPLAALWKCASARCLPLPNPSSHFASRCKIHNHNFFCKRMILKNRTMKPCCCDDACESVETAPKRFPPCTCRADFPAPFCENRGKSGGFHLISNSFLPFIHVPQQIPRIFFNSSPQALMREILDETRVWCVPGDSSSPKNGNAARLRLGRVP